MDALWTLQHHQKVLAVDPIAYWMQDEKSGTVAYDLVSGRVAGAQNGAYTGVTLGQPGIGDGRTAPLYDGINDYTAIYTAAFAGVWNGDEGSALAYWRVSGAGVWTDGAARMVVNIFALPSGHYVQINKSAANNTFAAYRYDGVARGQNIPTTSTDWNVTGITWSVTADEVRVYHNGALVGAPVAGLGAWANALDVSRTNIGCANKAVPNLVWSGNIAHVPVWDRPLSPAEIADLAVIE